MSKYQWTDWIEHVPGQELPAGMYAMFEFHGSRRNRGIPYIEEGAVTIGMKGHQSWYAKTPGECNYCMIIRYKLRVEYDEKSVERVAELELT